MTAGAALEEHLGTHAGIAGVINNSSSSKLHLQQLGGWQVCERTLSLTYVIKVSGKQELF